MCVKRGGVGRWGEGRVCACVAGWGAGCIYVWGGGRAEETGGVS